MERDSYSYFAENQAILELQLLKDSEDVAAAHHEADKVICKLLLAHGCATAVCQYRQVKKRCA